MKDESPQVSERSTRGQPQVAEETRLPEHQRASRYR